MDRTKPIAAGFEFDQIVLADDRYLLIPVGLEGQKQFRGFYSGSLLLSDSAWSAFGSGTGTYRRGWLNLQVVDLKEQRSHAVFDRQVALSGWDQSFSPEKKGGLRFANLLILAARTTDTNDDKVIDSKDAGQVFRFDLTASTLTLLSPEGYSVESIRTADHHLIMALRREADSAEAAVYVCDPITGQGSFAARGLHP